MTLTAGKPCPEQDAFSSSSVSDEGVERDQGQEHDESDESNQGDKPAINGWEDVPVDFLSQPSPTLARSTPDSIYKSLDRGNPLSKDELSTEAYERLDERRRIRRAACSAERFNRQLHKRQRLRLERIFEKYGATRTMTSSVPLFGRDKHVKTGPQTARVHKRPSQERDFFIRELTLSRSHRKNLEEQQRVLHEQAERLRLLIEKSLRVRDESNGTPDLRTLSHEGVQNQGPQKILTQQQQEDGVQHKGYVREKQSVSEAQAKLEQLQQEHEGEHTANEILEALAVGLVVPSTSLNVNTERPPKVLQLNTFYEDMDDCVAMRKSERHRRISLLRKHLRSWRAAIGFSERMLGKLFFCSRCAN